MMTATSPSKFSVIIAAAMAMFLPRRNWRRRPRESMPDTENGRYALSPVADGVIRLDTRTGEVSTCTNNGIGWACYAVPDERAALMRKSAGCRPTMKSSKHNWRRASRPSPARSTSRCRRSNSLKKPEPKVADGERKIEIPLPSDRDMDRMMSFLEQAWRRLVDMANRMQKDVTGKI